MKLAFRFSIPSGMDRALLDQGLANGFAIELDMTAHASALDTKSGFATDSEAAFLLDRALHLARELLLAGRVPAFAPAQVMALEPSEKSDGSHAATVAFPIVDGIPPRWYEAALVAAMGVCRRICVQALDDVRLEEIYRSIENKLIRPMRADVSSGKSTIPVLRVAYECGIPFLHLGMGVYQLGWGSKARILDRSATDRDSVIGSRLTANKAVAARLLRLAGLPAPVHLVVERAAELQVAIERIGFPLVVKPLDQERGEGVAVDIMDGESLREAYAHARSLTRSRRVIVERQVSGVCHRLFIAQGRLLYAVKRLPMSVRGDGCSTVNDLVARECAVQARRPPWDRGEICPVDDLALLAMRQAGYEPHDIPPPGCLVPLRRIESTAWGGVDEEVSGQVHADNVVAAIRAAGLFSLDVAGVDIITDDISKPWYESGAIINEVNFAPLLGGAEISRSHIPAFLNGLVDGDGRIPVEFFGPGGDSTASAEARRQVLVRQGLRCYLTTGSRTFDPHGEVVRFPFSTVGERIRALLCRRDVDAIVALR